jgi:signal transduction histidine kinase
LPASARDAAPAVAPSTVTTASTAHSPTTSAPSTATGPSLFPPLLLGLVLLLGVLTLVALYAPAFYFVIVAPEADHIINTVATLIAAGVSVLAWIRYRETGQLESLLASAAFLVLCVGNLIAQLLVVSGLGTTLGFDSTQPGQAPLYLWVAQRLLAAVLLVAAVAAALGAHSSAKGETTDAHAATAGARPILIILGPTVVLLLLAAVILANRDALPPLIPAPVLERVTQPLGSFDSALISLPMLIVQPAIAALFLVAGMGYGWVYLRRRPNRPYHAFLSAGLVVAAFSQLHFTVVPGAYGGLVSSGDVLRVTFYTIVGLGIAAAARQDLRELHEANASLHRLRAADSERIALEERARLAREIHDGLVQELWLARLTHGQLSQALEAVDDLPSAARQGAQQLDAILDNALAEARQALVTLQPQEDASFGSLLRRFVEDYADRFGLAVDCAVNGQPAYLPSPAQAEALRICREAINNARKHADGSVIRVTLDADPERVRLTVADDGRGFDTARPQRRGFGLRGMHERAASIGGQLHIDSEPAGGTRVTLELSQGEPGA